MYNTMLKNGYPRENIYVLYSDNCDSSYIATLGGWNLDHDPLTNNDIYSSCYESDITNVFNTLSVLTPEDHLTVFLDGHGNVTNSNHSYLRLPTLGTDLFDTEIFNYINALNIGSATLIVESCYSGSFINFTTQNPLVQIRRTAVTATDLTHPSMAEKWLTTTDPTTCEDPAGSEFALYFLSALKGYYPYINDENHHDVQAWNEDTEYSIATWDFNGETFPPHIPIPNPNPYSHHAAYNPDLTVNNGNNDGYISIKEAFNYGDDFDTFSPNGCFIPFYDDEDIHSRPGNYDMPLISFSHSYLNNMTLAGLTGVLPSTPTQLTLMKYANVCGTLTIPAGVTCTLPANSIYNIGDNGKIVVSQGATLVLGAGSQIKVHGTNGIEVNGTLTMGNTVQFIGDAGEQPVALKYYNTINNSFTQATFTNCKLENYSTLTITQSSFTNSRVQPKCNLTHIESSTFNNSIIEAEKTGTLGTLHKVEIISNTFANSATNSLIRIASFPNFLISNNELSNSANGIKIDYSGSGTTKTLNNNNIHNLTGSAISIYSSTAYIMYNNTINTCGYGIDAANSSVWKADGNQTGTYQRFLNCSSYEVYHDYNSSPNPFRYNIINNAATTHYYFNCRNMPTLHGTISLANNNWDTNFNNRTDLYPDNLYLTTPYWTPAKTNTDELAENLYNTAVEMDDNGDYLNAGISYKQIVENYSNTIFAGISAKRLISTTENYDGNFGELKSYFENCSYLNQTNGYEVLKQRLIATCHVKGQKFADAIQIYESIIDNPPSVEDSVYAVIDAGYAYLLMSDAGVKYTGKYTNLVPENYEMFYETKDALMNTLLGANPNSGSTQNQPEISKISCSNFPNPFNPSTTVKFTIPVDSNVEIIVYNTKGQKVKTLVNENKLKGNHTVVWNGKDENNKSVGSGIYFCKVTTGKHISSHKMVLIK